MLFRCLLQNFAHDMIAVLWCDALEFVIIWWADLELEEYEILIKFELWI